jgi:P27 family predicted phage terminase small subunit
MSNPPVPLRLKLLRGNPGKRAIRPEPEPARDPQCPDPPRHVRGLAADEWWRVGPPLWSIGVLRVTDVAVLAAYCVQYARWIDAETLLARMADNDPVASGLLIRSADGTARGNPLERIAARAAESMLRFASELGLTPVARSRLAAGINGQPPGRGKFDGLLG